MNDNTINDITNAYKSMQKSGLANAKTSSDVRKSIPKDQSKFNENLKFREAFMNLIEVDDYEPTMGGHKEPEKKIDENLMSIYVKNCS